MKMKLIILKGKAASTLLLTLFLMFILVMSIGGYLYYVEQQNRMGARAQAWNMAMALSEAGIEEGLEVLNSWGFTTCPPSSQFTANGWQAVSNNAYSIDRNLPGGSYTVTVDVSDCYHPVITSWASMTPPPLASRRFFFAALQGNTTTPSAKPVLVSRGVQVKAYKGSIWVASLAARGSIGMSGNSDRADVNSFDDSLNGGVYSPSSALSNAVVASLNGTVNVGNWNIDGKVEVSPTGSTYVGPNGSVTGGISHDANFTFPNTGLPDYSLYQTGDIPGGTNLVMISPGSASNACNLSLGYSTNQYAVTNWFYQTNNPSSCGPYRIFTSNAVVTISGTNNVVATITNHVVVTNCASTAVTQKGKPANNVVCPGSTPTQTGNSTNNNSNWSYIPISGYTTNDVLTYYTNGVVAFTTNWYPVYVQTNYTVYTNPVWQTNSYTHIICGNYVVSDASALSGNTIVTCPSTVVALNGISLSGNDQVYIGPNASLQLDSSGNISLHGNGVVNTNPGVAENLSIVCTTNVTSVDIAGNGQFTGTVLAPDANVKLNGGGSGDMNVIGAIMANTVTMSGHMSFHYPESLSRAPTALRYVVQSWRELDHQ
jgi:hypothetical protein